MTSFAIALIAAGAIGFAGAALGVRDLKRRAEITIERGIPRAKFPTVPPEGVKAP